MPGQIIKRGSSYTVRAYLGRDPATGKRRYVNRTVRGTKRDAEKVLVALLRQRDLGELVLTPTTLTVAEYLERWLATAVAPRVRQKTLEDYRGLVKRYIVPALGHSRLGKLVPLDVQGLYTAMLEKGLSARTVRYCHSVFRNALEQAVRWRLLSNNPANHVELPKQSRTEMRAMSRDEADRFLKAAQGSQHHALFALLLATGMRPGEAVALRWGDFDAANRRVSVNRSVSFTKEGVRFHPPKTSRSRRTIALPDGLLSLLLERRGEADDAALIFPGKGSSPLDIRSLGRDHFKPLLKAVGLPAKIRLYDLRHTNATLLLQAGEHPKIVSERLGHASVMLTLDTYSHVLPGMQAQAAQKLDDMLFAAADSAAPASLN